MARAKFSLICSIAKDRAIGKDNKLLWDIPEDLEHFKKKTLGHVIIMGEKTYYSLGRPLPGRTNVVVTRNKNFQDKGVLIAFSLEEAFLRARKLEKNEVFIIGGGSIYRQTIDLADKLYLTIVEGKYEADTYFPDYSKFDKIVSEKKKDNGKYKFRFLELTK